MNDDIRKDELKENIKAQDTWLRLVFIIIYGAILWVTSIVLAFVVVFQFLSVLFTRETQKNLLEFGASLSEYLREIVAYLTFNSEYKPFPFGDWPGDNEAGNTKKTTAKKKSTAKKKKTAARKKTTP
ncbi:MAG TPA: DUF4389 domain-containing protein, partial [Gammaproteobacteria bacterium]